MPPKYIENLTRSFNELDLEKNKVLDQSSDDSDSDTSVENEGTDEREKHFPEEFDVKERLCKVYLRMEPALDHSAKIPDCLNSDSIKHWSVVFDFGGRKIKYDLYNSSGGLRGGEIWPKWDNLPREETFSCLVKSLYLGKMTSSPRAIYELAKNHKMNGETYHATEHNCQVWAMELLKVLNENFYKKAKERKLRPLKDRKYASCINCCVKVSCSST